MQLSTRISRTMAAAMAVAALAVAGTAGSASANPIDTVGPLNNGNVGYGNGWAGGNVTGSANLDWNNPFGSNLTTPRLTAPRQHLHRERARVEARMQIVHYSDAAHTSLIATRDGGTKTGTGAFLDVFPVVLGGVTSTATHVHVNLQKRIGGVWTTVATSIEDL